MEVSRIIIQMSVFLSIIFSSAMIKDSKIYELREQYEIPEDQELPPEILAELKNLNYL